ncbi:hypothetical protein HPB48_003465 [Haemaphysalis longicornis]|uniref:Uncharacterized protein n=1 Tax=Haemaphysalis longicornis TaxID=44386 RepID=A0A9J6GFE6_HAELO|nr:hypothetical protein HPB48_003465 [Haemaphysalis longicornis]
MECFKSGLPALEAGGAMEHVLAGLFSIDLGQEMAAYQAEYELLHELLGSGTGPLSRLPPPQAPPPPDHPDLEAQLRENRALRRQNMELAEQLQVRPGGKEPQLSPHALGSCFAGLSIPCRRHRGIRAAVVRAYCQDLEGHSAGPGGCLHDRAGPRHVKEAPTPHAWPVGLVGTLPVRALAAVSEWTEEWGSGRHPGQCRTGYREEGCPHHVGVLRDVSNNHVSRLESSVSSYQGTVQHLEGRIRQLEDERDALLHSNAALRHRLDRLEAADERSARSLSFGAAGEAHDDIAQMVRRLGVTVVEANPLATVTYRDVAVALEWGLCLAVCVRVIGVKGRFARCS